MRVQEMKFREISIFLERSELEIASKYFDLVPLYNHQPKTETERQLEIAQKNPPPKQTTLKGRANDISRQSTSMSSLTLRIRSLRLTVRASQSWSAPLGIRRQAHMEFWQLDGRSAEERTRVTVITNNY